MEREKERARKGIVSEPGTGLPVWNHGEIGEYVVSQIRTTQNWIGERVATENVDDSRIADDCALRPAKARAAESAVRQCEYGMAAAILVRLLEIC